MDCIPYINDLQLEINILEDVKLNGNCDSIKVDRKINEKKFAIERCKENLSKLSKNKIEYRLYLKLLNGLKASKAIEEIASENYQNGIKPTDISTIWTKYYKNLKKIIESK